MHENSYTRMHVCVNGAILICFKVFDIKNLIPLFDGRKKSCSKHRNQKELSPIE